MSDTELEAAETAGHEPLTVSVRGVLIALAVLFAVVILSLLVIAALDTYFERAGRREPTVAAPGPPIEPPTGVPQLDAHQAGDLRQVRAREQQWLSEYAWVDREAGVARIPIGRAMEIVSQSAGEPPEPTNRVQP